MIRHFPPQIILRLVLNLIELNRLTVNVVLLLFCIMVNIKISNDSNLLEQAHSSLSEDLIIGAPWCDISHRKKL